MASHESQTLRLEQEVRVLREEARVEESRFHYLPAALNSLRGQQYRLQEEMRGYLTGGSGVGSPHSGAAGAIGDSAGHLGVHNSSLRGGDEVSSASSGSRAAPANGSGTTVKRRSYR